MKKSYIFIFLAVIVLLPVKGFSAGGPDAYGYTWKTSLDAGGPAASWIDITARPGVQNVTGLADDNSAASMANIGFNFHYYWNDYSQLKVGSNGWLSFNNVSNIASCFPTIPTGAGAADNYLAPLMGDLNFTGAGNIGQVKYWTNNVDTFIVSYINVPFWTVNAPGWTGSNSFQVILCNSDSSITYQYAALGGFTPNAACIDLTVGIENSTGAIGLQVHSDAMPPNNYAIRFEYPETVLLSIRDALPHWNANTENKAEIILQNVSYPLVSSFRNAGNTNITTTINLQATVQDAAMASVHSTSGSLPMLAAGDDSVFTYPSSWTPTTAGQYTFRSELTNSQDINAANNINNTELDVVDGCAAGIMPLNYLTTGTPNGSLNWNGGANDDGAAVYFKPPVYPYTIAGLQYYISSNVSDGFIAQVYDDDGLNGTAGTLLFTTNVTSVLSAAWNTVPVSPGVTLTSGGFYVVWIQTGTTIFLGTESNGPRSHRNFEILDGSWASYREDNIEDLCIRAGITNFPTIPAAGYTASATMLNAAFTNTSSGPPSTSWAWNFGDGNTSTAQNPSHTYTAPGTYNICLIAASPCGADTICQSITVCTPPAAAYSHTESTLTATFSDLSTGSADTFAWDFGDGNTSISQNPSHTYASAGTYNVCLIATSSCGDHDTICQSITVCDVLTAGYAYSNTNLDVAFTDNSTAAATSWAWDFGDGNTSTSQDPLHTYAVAGTYNVCLVATSACGADTICQSVTVCSAIAAAYTYSDNLLNVAFTDNSTGAATSWAWDFGDSNTSTSQNPSHAYTAPGIYNVCLSAINTCGDTADFCQQIVVCEMPVAAFTATENSDSLYTTDQSTGSVIGWAWDFGDGNTSTQQDAAHSYAADGTYTVCLVTTDTCGNTDTACQSVTILITSIADLDQPIVRTYPNPASDQLTVTLQRNLQNAVLEIVDLTGKSVWSEARISTELVTVDVSTLAPGMYLLRLSHAQGSGTMRFIKE